MDIMIRSLLFMMVTSASANMAPFIVNGQRAFIKDWPFIAFIAATGKYSSACGGSLISSQTVLTAAHCVDDLLNGDRNQFHKWEFWIYMGHRRHQKAVMTRRVVDYHSHEEYQYDSEVPKFDISVLFLSHKVKFLNTVKKVILVPQSDFFPMRPNHRMFEIAGWGAVSENMLDARNREERVLLKIGQVMFTMPKCLSFMKPSYPGVICAGKIRAHRHVFSGDSGGPLVRKSDRRQVGIVSTRLSPHGITIYSSIPHYYRWIKKTQKALFDRNCL